MLRRHMQKAPLIASMEAFSQLQPLSLISVSLAGPGAPELASPKCLRQPEARIVIIANTDCFVKAICHLLGKD